MAETDLRTSEDSWEKKETAGRFIRDVVIIAVVLAAGLGYYWYRTDKNTSALKTAKEAKDLLVKDNPRDYLAAELKLQEVLEKYDSSQGYALASIGELNALLWGEHKLADRKGKAEEFAAKGMAENPGIAEQFAAKALVDLYNGKAPEVEVWLKKDVLEKGAGAGRVFDSYGRALRAQGKLEEARRAFKAAHDADWRNPRFAAAIAQSYLEDGDTINAYTYFNKGLSLNGDHLNCKLGLARTRIMRGEGLLDASKALDEALALPDKELTPNLKAKALVARAELRLYEQKLDEAAADAVAAAQADPEYAPAYMAKGMALARKKDAGATPAFDKAIESDQFVAAFYWDAAHAIIDAGLEPSKALGYLERFPLPKDDRFYVKYGDALKKLGKADEAIAQFDLAIKDNGLNAQAHFSKGMALFEKKLIDEAAKEIDMAIGAQEIFPEAYIQRGNLLFEQKKYPEGCQEHATALHQYRLLKAPREKLTQGVEDVKVALEKAKQKDLAGVWEKEATLLIR